MAFTNFDTKEINCKILYLGPSQAGKTTTLQSIYGQTSDHQSGVVEFERQSGKTPYFDFLPVSLGHVKDFHLKLHLFTLPAQSLYQTVVSTILKGVDGFVFVADSGVAAMNENIKALEASRTLLKDEGINLSELPTVYQYNKRDLADAIPLSVLQKELNPSQMPYFESIAHQSRGTVEALHGIGRQVIRKLSS